MSTRQPAAGGRRAESAAFDRHRRRGRLSAFAKSSEDVFAISARRTDDAFDAPHGSPVIDAPLTGSRSLAVACSNPQQQFVQRIATAGRFGQGAPVACVPAHGRCIIVPADQEPPMLELKPIHRDSIPGALRKAERYRLLNEPREAESICRDVLQADPQNAEALVALLLCLTDQFSGGYGATLNQALEVAASLPDEYERTYYQGLAHERWARVLLARGANGPAIFGRLREALRFFEHAERLAPAGNDEAILRWNACVRLIRHEPALQQLEFPAEPGSGASDHPLD
jgi:tetratricopeptide (TPR) repeat protein